MDSRRAKAKSGVGAKARIGPKSRPKKPEIAKPSLLKNSSPFTLTLSRSESPYSSLRKVEFRKRLF